MGEVAGAAFSSWTFAPVLSLLLLLTGAVYFRGWRALRAQQPERFKPWRLTAFWGGLLTLWVAISSPLDAFGNLLLQVHMLQHWLLMMLAPPLLWLGLPAIALLRGLPVTVQRQGLGPLLAWPALRRLGRFLTHPLVAWFSFVIATWLWHAPAAYQLALRSPFWHEVEHACFVVTALMFWHPVILPWPSQSSWPRWAILPYLVLADLQNTAFSALFAFSEGVMYPVYASGPRLFGITALEGQASAGGLMWVLGSVAFLLPVGILLGRLLQSRGVRPGTLRAVESAPAVSPSARSRAPAPPRDLLRVPILGRILGARYFRRWLQTAMLLLAAVIVLDGLAGPDLSPLNLAGVLPWTYWRGFVVIGLLVAGNLFCMACPFMLPRAIGRRLLPRGRSWPTALRSKWLAISLLVAYLVAYEVFALWDSPFWTAWIVIGYFVAAFVVDGFFRGASFCKYLCPIGQFHFVASTVSPLEIRVRDSAVCARCTSHDCIRGNATQRGCELDLFQPLKSGNLDCTFCLDCVQACPHENVGVLAVVPGLDLIRDPMRASIGRLSARSDFAALALVVVFGAFANAAAMVAPVAEWKTQLAQRLGVSSPGFLTAALLVPSLTLLPALAVAACTWAGRALGRPEQSAAELARRFALILVPLGFGLWFAHFCFHLVSARASALPAIQRAAETWLGLAGEFGAGMAALPGWLLPLELLALDAGLLLTLYLGWRVARTSTKSLWRAGGLLLPWGILALLLYAVGFWILLQPMQMRGTGML